MAGIAYQCNVQPSGPDIPEDAPNLGCGTIFESKVDLPPAERLCPKCTGDIGKG